MTRFVLTWLSTAAGGAERSVAELTSALASSGHEVMLVWWDATGTDSDTLLGLPGGIIEINESPLSACVREVREELEIDPIIDHLAAIDWVPPRPPKTAGNMYLFTGRIPALASIRLDPTELSAWAWVTPTEIPHLLAAHTARRVDAALAAHTARGTVYLEDGYHPLPSCS